MDSPDSPDRLSQIKTHWSAVFQAHQKQGDEAGLALRQLVLRYYGAVYRYLLAMLRDPNAARDLTQEFAVAFLRGDFKRADPDRGRFRDYLKKSVRCLVLNYWARTNRVGEVLRRLTDDAKATPEVGQAPPADQGFIDGWREELLARTWEDLERMERETGAPHFSVLRLKTQHPELRSARLAEVLALTLGNVLTAEGVRQAVHRARESFARLLVEEVARSLPDPTPEALEQELIDLGLLVYCQAVLKHRPTTPTGGPRN
jgi:RNA polymerase sigma-70 factor (ECF subfamily)